MRVSWLTESVSEGDIVAEVKRKIEAIPEVPRAEVELVWDPPWTRERLSDAARLELGMI